jgi:hypothetical protein
MLWPKEVFILQVGLSLFLRTPVVINRYKRGPDSRKRINYTVKNHRLTVNPLQQLIVQEYNQNILLKNKLVDVSICQVVTTVVTVFFDLEGISPS